jgi:hypothetical protein
MANTSPSFAASVRCTHKRPNRLIFSSIRFSRQVCSLLRFCLRLKCAIRLTHGLLLHVREIDISVGLPLLGSTELSHSVKPRIIAGYSSVSPLSFGG